MKTLADLKRKLQPGQKLKMIYRFKKLDAPIIKEVIATQSNGATFTKKGREGRSFFEYPKASLLEVDDEGFRTFNKGKRPLLPVEKKIMAGYEKTRDREREKIDMITDGSTTYWRKVRYYKKYSASYLIGNKAGRGMRYDYSSGLVWDDRVRGDLCLEYIFV